MKLLKWVKSLFNPESENIEPFPELSVKERTSEVVIKPQPPKSKKVTNKKSTGGKKNG